LREYKHLGLELDEYRRLVSLTQHKEAEIAAVKNTLDKSTAELQAVESQFNAMQVIHRRHTQLYESLVKEQQSNRSRLVTLQPSLKQQLAAAQEYISSLPFSSN
jgi:hypothetical protein